MGGFETYFHAFLASAPDVGEIHIEIIPS